jgi:hypothetical protein
MACLNAAIHWHPRIRLPSDIVGSLGRRPRECLTLTRYRLPPLAYTVTFDRSIDRIDKGSINESVSRIYPQFLKGKKPRAPTAAAAPLYEVLTRTPSICK